MYKDKDKQREANRVIQARRRAKGVTQGVTEIGCDKQGVTPGITGSEARAFESLGELADRPERTAQGNIRVSKPGDADYVPQRETIGKRGKDIKCFEDLPLDVQATINRVSESNEEKQKRTAVAIKYQHTFGAGAYYPHGAVCTGIVTGKPGDEDYNGICTPEWRAERGR